MSKPGASGVGCPGTLPHRRLAMLYVGMDVHQRSTAVCNAEGTERDQRTVKGQPRHVVE